MTDTFRSLCAELADALEAWQLGGAPPEDTADADLIARARAAMAQPEPEESTDEEIMQLACSSLGYEYTTSLLSEPVQCIGSLDALPSELVAFARAAIAADRALWARPAIKPVPVAERLPQPGKKVLAHYLNALGKPRTIIAQWVPAKTREDSPEGDIGEYDEDTDRFYWPQGWYEQIESWDELDALLVDEGEITHWQPLPYSPHHALPVPQP